MGKRGRKPHGATIVQAVLRLLARGKLSQRKIAHRLGLSHGSVQAIAAGKWCPPKLVMERHGPPVKNGRCTGCGGKLADPELPCTLCVTRRVPRFVGAMQPEQGRHYRRVLGST